MNELRRNTLVGGFVLGSLAALGTLIVLYGKEQNLLGYGGSQSANSINIRFDKAYGIKPGNPVNISGIKVGQVRTVSFTDPGRFESGVNVLVTLDHGIQLHQGAAADTSEPGFGMGRPPIELYPGASSQPPLASGEIINGRTHGAMESMLPPDIVATFQKTATQLGEASVALTPVLADLHDMLESREPGTVDLPGGPRGNLSSAATRLDQVLKNFAVVFGDQTNQAQLKETLQNINKISVDGVATVNDLRQAASDIRQMAGDGKTLVQKAGSTVDSLNQRAEEITRSMIHSLDLASRFMENMNVASEKMNRGEGSLGMLLNDQRLYEAMTLTFRRLAETAQEFAKVAQQWQEGKIKVAF